MLMVDQKILGILFGVCAGAMWAVEAVLGKILFSSFSFVQVTASEVFFAALTAFAYVLATNKQLKLDSRGFRNVLVVGLVGTVFAPLMYFFGLSQTFAINATLIAHLQPLFVAVFGFCFLKERLRRHDFVGGVLIILAAILITSRTIYNLATFRFGNFGDLMVFFAMLSWAVVAIPGKRLTGQTSSVAIVCYRFLIASVVLVPILLCLNQFIISSIFQVLLGVLVGLGYIFYYEGLKRIKSSQVALTELTSPFFTAILAWNFLGETIVPMQMIGALLLIPGLYILTREKPEQ